MVRRWCSQTLRPVPTNFCRPALPPAMMMVLWGQRLGLQDVQHAALAGLQEPAGAVIFRPPAGATVEV
jgi:hypothetical protein